MQNLRFALILNILIILTLFCTPASQAEETIRIGGTGSGIALLRLLGESFMKQHPGIKVKVVSSLGSTGGIKAVSDGALEIAVSTRPPKADEKGLESIRFAITPLVFATHTSVNLKNITTIELEQIYAGLTTYWPDGSRLRLVLRPEKETDTQIIRKLSATMDRAITAAMARQGMMIAVNDQDNLKALERTPGSIAPITIAMIAAERANLNILNLNGVKPTTQNISNGLYPLKREFYLIIRPSSPNTVRQFMTFVRTPEAVAIMKKAQCLPGN